MIESMRAPALRALGAALMLSLVGNGAKAQQPGPILIPHPSWECYLPDGIPTPEAGEPIFELEIPLDRAATISTTPFGERSVAVGLLRGSIDGPRLSGAVPVLVRGSRSRLLAAQRGLRPLLLQ